MTPSRRGADVIDEDDTTTDRRSHVTKSPRTDRLVTWGLLLAGSGAATIVPQMGAKPIDPAPQIEKLAAEMRSWRETVAVQLSDIRTDMALVKFQVAKPDVSDDRFRKLEDRLLLIEQRK